MLIPTTLMGATLPTLVKIIQFRYKLTEHNVSVLYAVNTFGAVIGVLFSAFFAIELFGLTNTVLIAAAINILIALTAFTIRVSDKVAGGRQDDKLSFSKILTKERLITISAFAVSGFVSIAYEVLWTRILTPTVGTFIYAFATILLIYLLGIAIGSLFYKTFSQFIKAKNLAFAVCELGIGMFVLASVILAHKVVIDTTLRIAVVILPATIFMGLTFPAVVSLITKEKSIGKLIGLAYFANTIGSIAGGFAASFILIPIFGSAKSIAVLSMVNFIIALVFLFPKEKQNLYPKYLTFTATFLIIIFASWLLIFKRDRLNSYTTDLQILQAKLNKLDFEFREDEAASVYGYLDRKSNDQGLFIDGVATTSRVAETRLMAHIPIILHGNPESILVIAFGMGTTYRSSLAHDIQTDAIELVPSVPKFMHFFHPDASEVLANPRGKVIINDGRNYAFLTRKKYDIVIIDPPPPFNAAGTTVLHSREFYEDLSKILNSGGIVGQWIYYNASRKDDISMAIKSFLDVFPYVLAFQKTGSVGGLFLEGSYAPLDEQRMRVFFENEAVIRDLGEIADSRQDIDLSEQIIIEPVGSRESLLREFGNSPSLSDNYPRTEYFLLRHKFRQSPILVEDESLRFIEKLKEDYAESKAMGVK